ncbi:hypothetical protein RBU10_32640, partial [Pseudomonas aeruginosa]|nr:hypothetical protein [Pseudomonas aeruginosa]
MIDYIRDGQAIYRQSFATIRAYAKVQVPGEYSVTVTHPD